MAFVPSWYYTTGSKMKQGVPIICVFQLSEGMLIIQDYLNTNADKADFKQEAIIIKLILHLDDINIFL